MALVDCWHEAMGTYFSERNGNLDFYDKSLHFLVSGNFYLTTITTIHYCGPSKHFCGLDTGGKVQEATCEQDSFSLEPLEKSQQGLASEMKGEGEAWGKGKPGDQRQSKNSHMWQ